MKPRIFVEELGVQSSHCYSFILVEQYVGFMARRLAEPQLLFASTLAEHARATKMKLGNVFKMARRPEARGHQQTGARAENTQETSLPSKTLTNNALNPRDNLMPLD